jgi:4-hydroxybenzoate polyprenyltransferase
MAAPAGSLPDARYLATFAVGAFVMRGAGCTINDMWDVKYDRQVRSAGQKPGALDATQSPSEPTDRWAVPGL